MGSDYHLNPPPPPPLWKQVKRLQEDTKNKTTKINQLSRVIRAVEREAKNQKHSPEERLFAIEEIIREF